MSKQIPKERWLIGLEKEKEYNSIEREDLEERLIERRQVWARLLDLVKDEVSFDNSKRILDIGSEATSIFLVLWKGEKYAVDPLFDYLFHLHPFLKEIEEYKDVNFISCPIEDMASGKSFDIIFMLAALEHVGELKPVLSKIDELLAAPGILVILVECYAGTAVRNIMRFFDIYPYHPHHFVADDIIKIFSKYTLKKQEPMWEVYRDCPLKKGQKIDIKIYRIDKLIARIWQLAGELGRKNILFAAKLSLCYSLALSIALLRRRERPFYPLAKPWLFILQKQ